MSRLNDLTLEIQKLLNELGSKVDQDSFWGPGSAQAVIDNLTELKSLKGEPAPNKASNQKLISSEYFIGEEVHHFCQADPRWKGRTLGENRTFQQAGCALCCISSVFNYYIKDTDFKITPVNLDEYLDENNGYVGDSVSWGIAGQYMNKYGIPVTYVRKDSPDIGDIKRLISEDIPVLLRVAYADRNSKYDHFVLGVGYINDNIYFHDPASSLGDCDRHDNNSIEDCIRHDGYSISSYEYYEKV